MPALKLQPSERRYQGQPSDRDLAIYDQWSTGTNVMKLAKEHGINRVTVFRICKRVANWRAKSMMSESEALRERQAELYGSIVPQVVQAWQDSRQPKIKKKITRDASGQIEKTEETIEPASGDPRLVDALERLLKGQRELYGIAPSPVKVVNNTALTLNKISVEGLPDSTLKQLRLVAMQADNLVKQSATPQLEAASEIDQDAVIETEVIRNDDGCNGESLADVEE